MSTNLEVLLVEDEPLTANSLREALESRGHRVLVCHSAEEASGLAEADVLITDVRLGGKSGLDLLNDLRKKGHKTRAVVITGLPTFEICQRALRLGASEVLAKPFRMEELIGAVEGTDPQTASQPTLIPFRTVADESAPERICRKITAFALELGVPLAARARLASACGEIVHNSVQHAYGSEGGSITTEAWLEDSTILVRLTDEGAGFDALHEGLAQTDTVFDGGLARVSSLIEDLEIRSTPGAGTQVTLRAHATTTRFDNDHADLSDVDFLLPGEACQVLRQLGEPQGLAAHQLPAHLAICVGRLLGGPDPKAILRTAMRS
jgi:ActR/RegA family two-component response regulator